MSLKFPLKFKSQTGEKRSELERFLDALQLANHGWFPFARNHSWHGGVHITGEMGGGDAGLQVGGAVNAIGKGEVVAFRMQEGEKPKDDRDAKSPYSTGFVLIKHKYELPVDEGKTPEIVDYFSLYMHMRSWKKYKADKDGNLEIPAFLDTSIVKTYKVKGKINLSSYVEPAGAKAINLLEKTHKEGVDLPDTKSTPIMGTNIRSGSDKKTVAGFPEGMLVYAIPINTLPASRQPAQYKKDKNRALIISVKDTTIPPWYDIDVIPDDAVIYIGTKNPEVEEMKSERKPEETPKIAIVGKGPAQTGFKFDEVIVCKPPIPIESSSVLGYLGHWDQKDLMHFEIFCGGSDKAKIIEKGQAAALKDKQKSKTFIKKGTALYQHNAVPAQADISAKRKYGTDNAIALKYVKTDGDYDQIKILGDFATKKEVVETKDIKISGTEQTLWMKKDTFTKNGYSIFKGDEADYYTWQAIKGWSAKPLDEIIPDASENMKTVPFDLYSKKTGNSVTFQKNKYSELTIRQKSCDKNQPYTAYVKGNDITKYSKHEWKDFTSIKESNPASIGTAAKENLVSVRAQEINAVPALGTIASKDDDLSTFAKEILKKVGLHETGEQTEQEKPLLSGYRKLPDVYKCEEQRNKLIRLVCRHPTEWNDTPKKAEVLKLNDAQKKQIKALSWWDEASGVDGLPQPQNVWHFHPAGFVGNLMGGGLCGLTVESFEEISGSKSNWFMGRKSKSRQYRTLYGTYTNIHAYDKEHLFMLLSNVIEKYDIGRSCIHVAHFLSQIFHESASFDSTLEYASGGAYEGRLDLGNTQSGDGKRFRGRGLIQLTGRSNYTEYQKSSGVQCLTTPDIVGNIMENATDSAGWYWVNKGNINSKWEIGNRNINDLIDKYPMDVTKVTKAVNGGKNGLAERKKLFKEILEKMGK